MQDDPRPLSPHLQVYRPQLTSLLSISHRASGVFLALGAIALVYWLSALAAGPEVFAQAQILASSWYGHVLLVLWSLALFYHLCNGIRHLCWDAGYGFELRQVYASGYLVLVAAVVLTAGTWILALAGGQ